MSKRLSLLLSLFLCLTGTSMKCVSDGASSSAGGGTVTITLPGVGTVSINVNWEIKPTVPGPGNTLTVPNPTTGTLEGCILFKDAAGNIIATVPVQIPPGGIMTTPVPTGAVSHNFANGDDCPGDEAPAPASGGPALAASQKPSYFRSTALYTLDLSSPNQEHYLTGRATEAALWTQTANYIEQNGFRRDVLVRPGVTNLTALVTEYTVRPGNDIEVTIANNHKFATLELWMNGVQVMDQSQGHVPSTLGAGWDAYSFLLPATLSEFDYSPVSGDTWKNEVEFRFTQPNDPADYAVSRMVEFTSN